MAEETKTPVNLYGEKGPERIIDPALERKMEQDKEPPPSFDGLESLHKTLKMGWETTGSGFLAKQFLQKLARANVLSESGLTDDDIFEITPGEAKKIYDLDVDEPIDVVSANIFKYSKEDRAKTFKDFAGIAWQTKSKINLFISWGGLVALNTLDPINRGLSLMLGAGLSAARVATTANKLKTAVGVTQNTKQAANMAVVAAKLGKAAKALNKIKPIAVAGGANAMEELLIGYGEKLRGNKYNIGEAAVYGIFAPAILGGAFKMLGKTLSAADTGVKTGFVKAVKKYYGRDLELEASQARLHASVELAENIDDVGKAFTSEGRDIPEWVESFRLADEMFDGKFTPKLKEMAQAMLESSHRVSLESMIPWIQSPKRLKDHVRRVMKEKYGDANKKPTAKDVDDLFTTNFATFDNYSKAHFKGAKNKEAIENPEEPKIKTEDAELEDAFKQYEAVDGVEGKIAKVKTELDNAVDAYKKCLIGGVSGN